MDPAAQRLRLADGRELGYAEFGRPGGLPVLYHHGFPASRLEARLVEEQAQRLGLRLIAADRPGFGLSTALPQGSWRDWPADVAFLADHLGLARFAMLGVSGGAPATLACADRLADRLTAVFIVGGLGPVANRELRQLMAWPARTSFGLARRYPRLARRLFGTLIGPLLASRPALTLRLLTIAAPPADRAILRHPVHRERLTASLREAFRQGGAGPATELVRQAGAWPFDLADIDLPIDLYHGRSDTTVPHRHAEFLAAHLGRASLHSFPGEGHFSLPIGRAAEILGRLRDRHRHRA